MENRPKMVQVDLSGNVCIVTGANTGIGRITALELAKAGAHVFLASRSASKTLPVVREIRAECGHDDVEFLQLDLARFEVIRTAAQTFLDRELPLHILVNNAGLAGVRGLTPEGFEMAFGVNHLGHFLWTLLLLDRLKASAPARIVNVSSRAHLRAKRLDYKAVRRPTKTYVGMREYEVSKLANVLFTVELSRRLEGTEVNTYSLHPGVIASDIWRRLPWPLRSMATHFMQSNEEGAKTSLYCATAPELAYETGYYYDEHSRRKLPNPLAEDDTCLAELWRRSLEWTDAPDA
ncbi:MAG: SDR family oxidoreductase [Myxococcota bacterium]